MRRRLWRGTALVSGMLVAGGLAPPAHPHHAAPQFRHQRVYFHCPSSPPKLLNIGPLVSTTPFPSWNTTPPADSVFDGAGCGAAEPSAGPGGTVFEAVYEGEFVGNVDS